MITQEKAESIAQELLTTANMLGLTINQVDNLAREGWQAITDEQKAYEHIILNGQEMLVALRTLAMRLDRCTLAKYDAILTTGKSN